MRLTFNILVIFFLVSMATCFGANNKQLKIKSGIYISHVYGVDSTHETVRTSFWVWFIAPKDSVYEKYLEGDDSFYIRNAQKSKIIYTEKRNLPDGNVWRLYEVKADLYQDWDYTNFPNDKQTFRIIIDSQNLTTSELIFIPDMKNSKFGGDIELSGWDFGDFSITSTTYDYQSNFGLESSDGLGSDNGYNYSELIFAVPLVHADKNLDFKVYSLLYLACTLILFMFLIPIKHFWDRTSITTVAMLAVVGNMLAVDGVLPPSLALTNVDKLQAFALILMIVMFGFVIITEHLQDRNIKFARIINTVGFILCAVSIVVAFIKFTTF